MKWNVDFGEQKGSASVFAQCSARSSRPDAGGLQTEMVRKCRFVIYLRAFILDCKE